MRAQYNNNKPNDFKGYMKLLHFLLLRMLVHIDLGVDAIQQILIWKTKRTESL